MGGSIDRLCERMRYWCNEGNLGYDQGNRQDIRYGGECDCSSLVIFALKEAGFDTGSSTYTGNMSANLCERGWERVANNGNPRKGDILLNDRDHVAVWLGDCVAQASIDENGNITGGQAGDQSGRETNTCGYYNYPWNCYLRYTGGQSENEHGGADESTTDCPVPEIRYRASVDHSGNEWLNEYVGFYSDYDDDGFVGIEGKPMLWLSMGFPGWYQVQTEDGGWLDPVREYDTGDLVNGCAGDGSPITAVRCYYETPDPGKTGYHVIEYEAAPIGGYWLGRLHDLECLDGDPDDFAGNGKRIDRFRARVVKQ